MASHRTLKRRRQRIAAKSRPPRRPMSAIERLFWAQALKNLEHSMGLMRVLERQDAQLSVIGAKIGHTVTIRIPGSGS